MDNELVQDWWQKAVMLELRDVEWKEKCMSQASLIKLMSIKALSPHCSHTYVHQCEDTL